LYWELIVFGLWELICFGAWELIFCGLGELICFGLWELIFPLGSGQEGGPGGAWGSKGSFNTLRLVGRKLLSNLRCGNGNSYSSGFGNSYVLGPGNSFVFGLWEFIFFVGFGQERGPRGGPGDPRAD